MTGAPPKPGREGHGEAFYLLRRPGECRDRTFTAVDLFCGAGGITLGLLNAGYDVRFCSDIMPASQDTHETNFPDVPFCLGDVRRLDPAVVLKAARLAPGELDLLVGGPPCQGFSIIGERNRCDPRNQLFISFLTVAASLRPKCVVMENVTGLATMNKGDVLRDIGQAFDATGYTVSCAELLAAQYGVPQMRWRMIFIGWRKDGYGHLTHAGFPAPTHGPSGIGDLFPNRTITAAEQAGFLTTRDAIGDLPAVAPGGTTNVYSATPTAPYQKAMRHGLTTELFNHYAPAISEKNLDRIRALKPGEDWRQLPNHLLPEAMKRALRKDHTRRYRRMTWEGVPRSVITKFRDPKSGEYSHPDQDRTISIREAARIQSLPDWFMLGGTNSDQYEQVGNAVPPLMARAIGLEVRAALEGLRTTANPPRSRYRIPRDEPSLFASVGDDVGA